MVVLLLLKLVGVGEEVVGTGVLVVRVMADEMVVAVVEVEGIAKAFTITSGDAADEASHGEHLGRGFVGVARSSSPVSVILLPFSSWIVSLIASLTGKVVSDRSYQTSVRTNLAHALSGFYWTSGSVCSQTWPSIPQALVCSQIIFPGVGKPERQEGVPFINPASSNQYQLNLQPALGVCQDLPLRKPGLKNLTPSMFKNTTGTAVAVPSSLWGVGASSGAWNIILETKILLDFKRQKHPFLSFVFLKCIC